MRIHHDVGLPVPIAELLLVAGLFWVVIVGNVLTDVLGTVVFRRATITASWAIMMRGYEPRNSVGDPKENFWIFWPPPVMENQLGQSVTTWPGSPPPGLPGALTRHSKKRYAP